MTQKNRKLSVDSSSVDELTPLVMRRGSCKKCSRSLSLGNVESEARQLNQSLKMSFRDQTLAGDHVGRSDVLIISHSYLKYNETFHKLFQEIPKEERLTHTFTCALQKEVLYHGRLFVSQNHVCFYSSVLLKATKVVIAISSMREIKKHNPALSVLSVRTSSGEKYLFALFRKYTVCYRLLQSLCCQAQEGSPNRSPYLSSAEFEAEQDMASSFSSSESFDNVDLNNGITPINDEANGTCRSTQGSSFKNENSRAESWISTFLEKVVPFLFFREILSLRVVLHIFVILLLLLLLASGYLGLRITALEEQLSSLGALADLTSHYTEFQET
ncbi:GRAM domain-containing protein 2B-like [Girardinichthys multiradiatus]|uniref:GRAM domain-containing protein 2B-like n=1 Tax=Girardinichthys multiradiatus TaxID=208333 RepID=UPI001FACB50A|nr:GRAM domain-containing protein 2B-like [Girardinichthys multiradiatus]